jgi:hypothetical protein
MAANLNFVRQQGLRDATPASCAYQYPALMWQPRAIGVLFVVGLATQSPTWFLALWVLLLTGQGGFAKRTLPWAEGEQPRQPSS